MKGFQARLAGVMLASTLVAAAVIAAGLAWYLVAHPGAAANDHLFRGEPRYFRDPVAMVQHALSASGDGHRRSVIMIGVVLLLIGPLIRVGLAAWGYLREGDRLYAAVSAFVFVVLVLSFFW